MGVQVEKKHLNIQTEAVLDLINQKSAEKKPFTYIVVASGDDEGNIKVASRIARDYRRAYWEAEDGQTIHKPMVCVHLRNTIKSGYVTELFPDEEWSVPIDVFGTDEDTFTEKMLIDRLLWRAARMLHKGLKEKKKETKDAEGKKQEEDNCAFAYWSEYERRSSVASAAHAGYHLKTLEKYAAQHGYDVAYARLTPAQKKEMIIAEHKRWMNYSRCEGMRGISQDTALKIRKELNNHVDTMARLTPCLVETRELPGLYKGLYPNAKSDNEKRLKEGKLPYRSFCEKDQFVISNAGRLHRIVQGQASEIELMDFREFQKDDM